MISTVNAQRFWGKYSYAAETLLSMARAGIFRNAALVKSKARARDAGIPALYVNDNYGDWPSEKEVLMGRCLEAIGAQFVRHLLPDSEDYFVLKPMHSAFYMTPLEVLLQHLRR